MMIYLKDVLKIILFQMNFVVIGRVIKGCVRGWGVEKIYKPCSIRHTHTKNSQKNSTNFSHIFLKTFLIISINSIYFHSLYPYFSPCFRTLLTLFDKSSFVFKVSAKSLTTSSLLILFIAVSSRLFIVFESI